MTDTSTPTQPGARTPGSVLPAQLQPGDQIRDLGRLRTVAHIGAGRVLADLVIVFFEVDPADGDDQAPQLGIPAHQHVTVWRQVADRG